MGWFTDLFMSDRDRGILNAYKRIAEVGVEVATEEFDRCRGLNLDEYDIGYQSVLMNNQGWVCGNEDDL